jgi:hypothetical protein
MTLYDWKGGRPLIHTTYLTTNNKNAIGLGVANLTFFVSIYYESPPLNLLPREFGPPPCLNAVEFLV